MADMKHTPGPWLAHPFTQGETLRFRIIRQGWNGGERGLAIVQRVYKRGGPITAEAIASNASSPSGKPISSRRT